MSGGVGVVVYTDASRETNAECSIDPKQPSTRQRLSKGNSGCIFLTSTVCVAATGTLAREAVGAEGGNGTEGAVGSGSSSPGPPRGGGGGKERSA